MNVRCLFIVPLCALLLLVTSPGHAQDSVKESEQLDFAQGLLARGMYDMAIVQCQKFITDYPHSPSLPTAYLSLGEGYFLSQNFKKAVEIFTQFNQLYPTSDQLPVSLMRLAQIDIQQKNYDQALKELTSVDAQKQLKGPMLQSFDFYMAQAYLGKSDSTDAMAYYQKATQVDGASAYTAYAWEELGKIEAQNGQYSNSMDDYAQSMKATEDDSLKAELTYRTAEDEFLSGKYGDAIKQFEQVLDQNSTFGFTQDALANMLLAYFNLGQYDQLIMVYQQRSPQIKNDSAFLTVHLAAVQAYIELKKYDQANALLDRLLSFPSLKPQESARIFIKKADILTKEGKYKNALALLDAYAAADADHVDEAYFLRAQAYYGLGDFDHAFSYFENVYVNYPNSSFFKAALLGQAHARQKMRRFNEAEALFLKYCTLQDDPVLKSDALYNGLMMALAARDVKGVLSAAQDYLKLFPNAEKHSDVLLILADNSKPQDAINLLQGYLATPAALQRPNSAYFLLGYNEQLIGNSDQALAAYSKVDQQKEKGLFYAAAIKNMAITYLSQKNMDQARIYFDRLISGSEQSDLQIKTYIWVCNQYLKERKYDDVLRVAAQSEKHFSSQDLLEIRYFKAEALRGQGHCDEADKNYGLVTASKDKNAFTGSAHIGYGLCLENDHKYDEARKEFQSSLDENADDATVTIHGRFEMANLEASQGNFELALKYYLLVATIYDDDFYCSESLLSAAKISEHLGRNADALKMYAEILDKYKNSTAAVYAQGRVGVLK